MADKLVELRFAESIHRNDRSEVIQVVWTAKGVALKRELGLIFDAVRKGEQINALDIQMLFALFLRTDSRE